MSYAFMVCIYLITPSSGMADSVHQWPSMQKIFSVSPFMWWRCSRKAERRLARLFATGVDTTYGITGFVPDDLATYKWRANCQSSTYPLGCGARLYFGDHSDDGDASRIWPSRFIMAYSPL